MSVKDLLPLFAFLLLPVTAFAEPSPADEWFTPTKFIVRLGMMPRLDFSSATLLIATNGDTRIESSGVADGKKYSGVLFLVSGNYLLAKDIELSPGAEIDAIDAPVLNAQTAMKLLARALPSGPSSVTKSRKISITELKEPIEIATQSAGGAYTPPWNLTGTVKRESPTRVSFSLSFTFEGSPQPLSIVGAWEKSSPPTFEDSTSLKGWRAFRLGPYQSNRDGSTIFDYGAQEIPGGFSTIGEMRAYAKRKAGGA